MGQLRVAIIPPSSKERIRVTDWNNLGAGAEQAFERHRQDMVAHFIKLRAFDADMARGSLAGYLGLHGCPFPKIADDVKAAWAKEVEKMKAIDG